MTLDINKHILLFFLFLFFFSLFLVLFSFNYSLDHHAYIRIIEQNILTCNDQKCSFVASTFGEKLTGYISLQYFIHTFLKLFNFNNYLFANNFLASLFNSFFLTSLFYVSKKAGNTTYNSFVLILVIHASSPLLVEEMMLTEDNISYYGLVILLYYFFSRRSCCPVKDGFISGLLLGSAVFIHTSPLIFLFSAISLPLAFFINKDLVTKIFVMLLTSTFVYVLTFINIYKIDSFKFYNIINYLSLASSLTGNFDYSLSSSLGSYSFEQWFKLFNSGFISANGGLLYDLNLGFVYYLSYIALILFALVNIGSKLKEFIFKNLEIILSLCISMSIVFFYEPQAGERWDFFFLLLFYIALISFPYFKRLKHKWFLIIYLTIHVPGMIHVVLRSINYIPSAKNNYIHMYKQQLIPKDKRYYIFPFSYLLIDSFILTDLYGKEKNIYFFNENSNKFYQTPVSMWAKGKINKLSLWNYHFFINDLQHPDLNRLMTSPPHYSKDTYIYPGLKGSFVTRFK